MAPRMNEVINAARNRGVFIIHCPSDTINITKAGQRKLAQSAPKVNTDASLENGRFGTPAGGALPIDDSMAAAMINRNARRRP